MGRPLSVACLATSLSILCYGTCMNHSPVFTAVVCTQSQMAMAVRTIIVSQSYITITLVYWQSIGTQVPSLHVKSTPAQAAIRFFNCALGIACRSEHPPMNSLLM